MSDDITSWFWFLLVGGIIGCLAGVLVKGRGFGIVLDIVIGIVGALLGRWLFVELGISTYSSLGALVIAFVGAVIVVAPTRLFKLPV